jgi:hypothetical protein
MGVYTHKLSTRYINQLETEKEEENNNYKREYPLYSTTRLRRNTLERLKHHGRYGDSIDEIVVMLLDQLEGKEISEDLRSW